MDITARAPTIIINRVTRKPAAERERRVARSDYFDDLSYSEARYIVFFFFTIYLLSPTIAFIKFYEL